MSGAAFEHVVGVGVEDFEFAGVAAGGDLGGVAEEGEASEEDAGVVAASSPGAEAAVDELAVAAGAVDPAVEGAELARVEARGDVWWGVEGSF